MLLLSYEFLNTLIKYFFVPKYLLYLNGSFVFGLSHENNWTVAILLILSIAISLIRKSLMASYVLGFMLMSVVQIRLIGLGLWKVPKIGSIFLAISVAYFWNGTLQFIYKPALGYLLIFIHTAASAISL